MLLSRRLQAHVELVIDRANVVAVLAGREHEVVHDLELRPHGQDLDVLGLLFFRQLRSRRGQCLCVYDVVSR